MSGTRSYAAKDHRLNLASAGQFDKKFGSGKFTVPQKKAAQFNYGGMKNKGLIRLHSTAQHGLTIFWDEK